MTLSACPTDFSPTRHNNTNPTITSISNRPRNVDNPESTGFHSTSKHKRDSKISVATNDSARSHKEYLDSLEVPTREMVARIGEVQEQKEVEIIKKKMGLNANGDQMNDNERQRAAELIQRSYRGHRERRMLNGMSLDPSTRWAEAVKEARYRHITEPRSRESNELSRASMDGNTLNGTSPGGTVSAARQNWKKVGLITRRAGADEDSDDSGSDDDAAGDAHEHEEQLRRRHEAKAARQKAAKIMDLQYFLEMVDLKHRYGSNLRTYHEIWRKADTHENFFYWLDFGEGRYVDSQGCPRERLDRECVRYLSKEERLDYLVKIDKEGRLCWAKNGARIDTTEQYKDSIHGIVPATDDTPAFRHASKEAAVGPQDNSSRSSASTDESEEDRADKYTTPEFDNSKGMKKVKHVSAATIFNKLLRGSVKKNTWIFVADTNFRLYVGIKQSGAFQHSSFLHGSRISAAGLIKIKNGRLSKLSPLSGHYRPPVSNFRAFIHNLKDNGVDMSHVSISRSYAVLVGLEAYVKTRRRGKRFIKKLTHHRDKLLSPEEVAQQDEDMRDKSQSAEKERKYLERKAKEEQERRDNMPLMEKLHISHSLVGTQPREKVENPEVQAPGTGPENAIAPEGTRNV